MQQISMKLNVAKTNSMARMYHNAEINLDRRIIVMNKIGALHLKRKIIKLLEKLHYFLHYILNKIVVTN